MADSEQKPPQETPRSNLPASVKAAIVARHLAGESNSSIGRELHVSRQTVAVVLAESELGDYIKDAKSNFLNTIPLAVQVVIDAVKAGDLKASLALLKGIGVLTDRVEVSEPQPIQWDMPQPSHEQTIQ